jgi:DUF917 family protein
MPDGGVVTRQDVEDFARGTDFLSASGGGAPVESTEQMLDDVERGVALNWVDLDSIADDDLVVSTFYSGSIAPESFDTTDVERAAGVERTVGRPVVEAVRELERYLGVEFGAVISVEIGGLNTGLALDAAANLGKPMLDADYAGRAIPEAQCVTPAMFGESIAPMACVDYYGDITIIHRAVNNTMAERLGKFVAISSFGTVGCAGIPLRGEIVKRIAVPGTLSESLQIGRAIREAREAGDDPVEALAERVPNTALLLRGRVADRSWENRDGYMWGEHLIEGENGFAGKSLLVWFKNENHLSWLDNEPFVASPDIIEFVDSDTGEPRANTDLAVGDRIAVFGVRRRPQFDSPAGLAALGPAHWGFDFEFRPIEQLVAAR